MTKYFLIELVLTIFKFFGSYPYSINKKSRQVLRKIFSGHSFEPISLLNAVLGKKALLPEKNCKINLCYSYLEDQNNSLRNNSQPNAISHSSLNIQIEDKTWKQNLRDDLIAGFSFTVRCSKLP